MSGLRRIAGAACLMALAGLALSTPARGEGVPPAVQEMRRHLLDPATESFVFRNVGQFFDTRVVGRSGAGWTLPKVEAPMAFTYVINGRRKPAEAIFEDNQTNALLIVKDGRIVTEAYRNRSDAGTRFMSWSMAKSFTASLVGIALSEGRIKSLDDPLTRYLPELKGGAYDGVTIRQTLGMRSGADFEDNFDPSHPTAATDLWEQVVVQNRLRWADYASRARRAHRPGEVFSYKTLDTAVLGWLLERATGMTESAYLASRLWEPMGAEADGYFLLDGPAGVGREFAGAGFNATARDYARFGLLMLQDGVANGKRILPPGWVKEATRPYRDGELGALGYGYQWWRVAKSPAFFAWGLGGQFIFVDPPSRTVVVKMSYQDPKTSDQQGMPEALAFMEAAAAWTP